MVALSQQFPIDFSPIEQAIAMFGIPNPVEYLLKADADPDPIQANVGAMNLVSTELAAISADLTEALRQVSWTGGAAAAFRETLDSTNNSIIDLVYFVSLTMELLLAAVQLIFEHFAAIFSIIITLCAIITIIILVSAAMAAPTGGGSLATAAAQVWAAANHSLLAVISLVSAAATVLLVFSERVSEAVEWWARYPEKVRLWTEHRMQEGGQGA